MQLREGLSGWGSYDDTYKVMPYWGMLGWDLMKYLNEDGTWKPVRAKMESLFRKISALMGIPGAVL